NNLSDLGGIVDISSVVGEGTTLTMTLPITLAIIQALVVCVGDQRFAIPLNSVFETLLIETSEIQRSEGREILNVRGEALILRRLSDEFDIEPEDDERQYVVVLGLGELRLGLLVDRFEGQQDTVIKSIQGPVANVRGIAGATELGDRGAVLVIDVSSIVEDAFRRRDAA
ncbi:MAG: chemotaxis protein CheW, partial [Myxococcales bacterium]